MCGHTAKEISAPEARYIIAHETASKNDWVVIEHRGRWFDVRSLTKKQLSRLIDDLDRVWNGDVAAGVLAPH